MFKRIVLYGFLTIVAFMVRLSIGGELIKIESIKEIGGGMRLEMHAETSGSKFESVAHYRYLFYKDRKLGKCGFVELSKSKRYAMYQEVVSGLLFVFDIKNKKNIRISKRYDGLVLGVEWGDDESIIEVQFENEKASRKYKIKE